MRAPAIRTHRPPLRKGQTRFDTLPHDTLKAMNYTAGERHIGDLLRDNNILLKGADPLSQAGFN